MRSGILTTVVIVGLAAPAVAAAATLEPVGTFDTPTHIASDPDDPDRLFVVERAGEIQLQTPSTTSTFLDIKDLVVSGGEQGLLSVAFPPDHAETGLLYVTYTGVEDGDLFLAEFRAAGDSVDPATRRQVLRIEHSLASNHNGGQLQFGSDGYLYLATGDGGTGGAEARDMTSLTGKLLRLDPRPAANADYTIPADNPFVGAGDPDEEVRDEIWSSGLRNPWRWSFDRLNGALTIADVGEGQWEEVDYVSLADGAGRGADFGWHCREGAHDYEPLNCAPGTMLTEPIFEYPHEDPGNCSITGGYVVRDPAVSELYGRYLYADFCVGEVRSLDPDAAPAVDDRGEGLIIDHPSSFGQDACGRIYAVSVNDPVTRLQGAAPSTCTAHTLTIALAGDGSGRVTGPGFDCPGNCTETTFDGERAELAAAPDSDSLFAGWSGACLGPGKCTLIASGDQTATATFVRKAASGLTLKARRRCVRRGNRVRVTVEAAACPGRAGDEVSFLHSGQAVRTARLNQSCRARYRPRIRRTTTYRARIDADELHLAAEAGPVKIKVRRPKRH